MHKKALEGIYKEDCGIEVINSIVRNNNADWNPNLNFTENINYSNVGSGDDILNGLGNIDADPMFCGPDTNDYTLQNTSPCVGSGLNGADMGAFGVGCLEYYGGPVWYVSDGSDSLNNEIIKPFATIQKLMQQLQKIQ